MSRKSIPEKIKKLIFQEAGMMCPMCGETDVSTFDIHHIQPFKLVEVHDEDNMILLCKNCHGKVTAGDYSESQILRLKVALANGRHPYIKKKKPSNVINLRNSINTGILANKLEINSTNKVIKLNAPEGCIGANRDHRNYVKRLIDRYHEFKKAEVGTGKMNYAIFYKTIQRKFGAKWDMLPLNVFDSLCQYLQNRIDETVLGKNKKKKGIKRYSTFPEYLEKYSS
ncbi:MAG: HNH endonuclease [Deltaproteobacteria bacterium]|nr:HNH endonuclease [Deltaproteobacteria bacterium]